MRTHSDSAAFFGSPTATREHHRFRSRVHTPPDPATHHAPMEVQSVYPTRKRIFDLTLAGVALLLVAPLMVTIALISRVADGPGVLFNQRRVGRGGREFTLWKFRSLTPRDEAESATRWSISDDERLTTWGRFLRRSSLDELPQLFNILRGDMSLVGPRPERPHFAARFAEVHQGYRQRHRMPVGLTGLSQVEGLRGDTSITQRACMDNRYIERWSVWLDLRILIRTPLSMIKNGGR